MILKKLTMNIPKTSPLSTELLYFDAVTFRFHNHCLSISPLKILKKIDLKQVNLMAAKI